jgi:hypothetical protein
MDKKVDEAVNNMDNESKQDDSEHGAARPDTAQGYTELPRQEDMEAAAEFVIRLDKEAEEPIVPVGSASHNVNHAPDDANHLDADDEAAVGELGDTGPSFQPRPPIREILPGAYHIPGPGVDADDFDIDDDFTASAPFVADSPTVATNPTVAVSAQLFDANEENRIINERVERGLREARAREALAQVVPDNAQIVPADNVDDRPPPNTRQRWLVRSLNRGEIILGVITAVLFVVAIILWVIFATMEEYPIASAFPTQSPTVSPRNAVRELQPIALPPTVSPQPSPPPTKNPTSQPTITPRSTGIPSASPSDYPSVQPSPEPTFSQEISKTIVLSQRFQIGNELEFNETEQDWFCQTMAGYTGDFGGRDDGRVNSTCRVISQSLQIIGGKRRQFREKVDNSSMRLLQGVVFNQVDYAMTYRSKHTNVTSYPTLFQNYVNADLDRLTTDLQNARLAVTNSFLAFNKIATLAPTTLPTITPLPTIMTFAPVPAPTVLPSAPFVRPPFPEETAAPSIRYVPTGSPTVSFAVRSTSKKRSIKNAAIVVTVLASLSATALVLIIYFRRKRAAL